MKLLYMTLHNLKTECLDGVGQKILRQVKILRQAGMDVDYTYTNERKVYVCSGNQDIFLGESQYIRGIDIRKLLKNFVKGSAYDYVYIRNFGRIDPWELGILKELQKKRTRILYEIPTYPYEKEIYGFCSRLDKYVDRIFRPYLKEYVERVITFSNSETIFGIPAIKTKNGIIVDDIPMICGLKEDKQICLLAVAKIQLYAGYDRVIRGLNEYKKNGGNRIYVSIVGGGEEKEKLVHLSEKFGLSDIIKFYPPIYGEELDKMYEMADATLEVFGWHRTGVKVSSTLKSRESLAKGLPIITGSKLDICMDTGITPEFICEFPQDDSNIDFFRVEEFYDKLMKNRDRISLAKEIRQYAKNMIDMSITMQPVIEYIKSGKKE